jgi:tryptophanyl-tRNA synthetase
LREELGKKPSIDELWRYFENDSDKTEFIEDYTDTHLIWRDTKGSLHDCLKKTVANHLSRIKD